MWRIWGNRIFNDDLDDELLEAGDKLRFIFEEKNLANA